MQWKEIREKIAEKARENFENQESRAMGVEEEIAHLDDDYQSLARDVYEKTIENMGKNENIELKYEDDSPWDETPVMAMVHDKYFEEELQDVDGFFPDEGFFPESYDEVVAEVSYDLSNELEKATGVNIGLLAAHHERRLMDKLKEESLPEGTGLYRLGQVPERILSGVDGFYNRENFEDGFSAEEGFQKYMTRKRRYLDHIKSHGEEVMAIGGTDSLQVTMTPEFEGEVDEMVREFTGDEKPGIPAISPLLYAPFMSSPVIEEGELKNHMGRNEAYRTGFSESEYADNEGTRKFNYIPELSDVEGVENLVEVIAEKAFQFSAGVKAENIMTENGTLYEEYGDKYGQIEPDTRFNIRVGDGDVIDFTDFVDDRGFSGIITLPGEESQDEISVEVDYSQLSEEEFGEEAWGHFIAHSSGVWPSYRPRFDVGAFESRDYGNSPRIKEAVDTQAAVFLKWQEIQEYASENLGMVEEDAENLRNGVSSEGLDYRLPSGDTVRDAWLEKGGLLDILEEGVKKVALAPGEGTEIERGIYARDYRNMMEKYLERGSFSKEFAETYLNEGIKSAMELSEVKV